MDVPVQHCNEVDPCKGFEDPTSTIGCSVDENGIATLVFTPQSNSTPPGTVLAGVMVKVNGAVVGGSQIVSSPYTFDGSAWPNQSLDFELVVRETCGEVTKTNTYTCSVEIPGGSGEPKSFTVDDGVVTIDQCYPTDIDLSEFVTIDSTEVETPVYEIVSTNFGDVESLNGSTVCYTSGKTDANSLEAFIFRVTCGDETLTGTITVNMQNQFSEATMKAELAADMAAMQSNMESLGESAFYNSGWRMINMRNMFCGTCDLDYWQQFKDYFDVHRNAVNRFQTVDGTIINPAWGPDKALYESYYGVPAGTTIEDWQSGTTYPAGTYVQTSTGYIYTLPSGGTTGATEPTIATSHSHQGVQYDWASSNVSTKSLRQWALGALTMLWEVLCNDACDLDAVEIQWATDAYNWVSCNVIERLMVSFGQIQQDITEAIYAAHIKIDTGGANITGYWDSNTMLAVVTNMLDDKVGECVGRARPSWRDVEVSFTHPTTGVVTTVKKGDYETFYQWFIDGGTIDNGCFLWDTVSTASSNPNINTNEGFGCPGEYPAPDTAHAWRHAILVYMAVRMGCTSDTTARDAIAKTFSEKICLPLDYETTDGDHAGVIAGTQQTSNYIDGHDGPFRDNLCTGADFDNEANSNNGMAGIVYSGFAWGAVYEKDGLRCLQRLYVDVRAGNFYPPNLPLHTGTWYRNQTPDGRYGLASWLCFAKKER